jgi:hypothetical protein
MALLAFSILASAASRELSSTTAAATTTEATKNAADDFCHPRIRQLFGVLLCAARGLGCETSVLAQPTAPFIHRKPGNQEYFHALLQCR